MAHFNSAARQARLAGLDLHIQLYINNSPKEFTKKMKGLYRDRARFRYHIEDLGQIKYETEFAEKDFGVEWKIKGDDGRMIDTKPDDKLLFSVKHFDVFRLLAEIFNKGIDYSVKNEHDFYGILSGDQLLPPEHPVRMVDFLDEHKNCGVVSSLAFFDDSKKEIIEGQGVVKTFMVPLIMFHQHDDETPEQMEERRKWVYAHLLPHPENGGTGMEYCEVDALGTGGAVIPREVFTKLKFVERAFDGQGEDIQYCIDVRTKLGKKIFVIPTVVIENRYPDGTRY